MTILFQLNQHNKCIACQVAFLRESEIKCLWRQWHKTSSDLIETYIWAQIKGHMWQNILCVESFKHIILYIILMEKNMCLVLKY